MMILSNLHTYVHLHTCDLYEAQMHTCSCTCAFMHAGMYSHMHMCLSGHQCLTIFYIDCIVFLSVVECVFCLDTWYLV